MARVEIHRWRNAALWRVIIETALRRNLIESQTRSSPLHDDNLRWASQIGVSNIIYCEINDDDQNTERRFPEVQELIRIRERVESFGMSMSLLETAFPMDKIIVSKPGRDEQIEQFRRALDNMGKTGMEILCYDWMPTDASVVRTSFTATTRGALTNAFDLAAYRAQSEQPAILTNTEE